MGDRNQQEFDEAATAVERTIATFVEEIGDMFAKWETVLPRTSPSSCCWTSATRSPN